MTISGLYDSTFCIIFISMVDLASVAKFAIPPQNIVGSTLFLVYIALALYGTFTISTSLYSQYRSIATSSKPKEREKGKAKGEGKTQGKGKENQGADERSIVMQNARKRHIKIYAFLASISFASLSYHMLFFLTASYTDWSGQKALNTKDITTKSLKEWMLNTSFFDTFAKDLVRDGPSAAWTQVAILATYFWNVWIAGKVQQRGFKTKTIFPYIVLSQILPISLTASLFIIQLHLSAMNESTNPNLISSAKSKFSTSKKVNPTLPTIIINAALLALPSLRQHPVFIPLVLVTRFILLVPFSGRVSLRDAHVVQSIAISGGFVFAQLFMMRATTSMGEVVRGVWTGGEAVKALGWDAQLGGLVHLVLSWGGGVY